MRTDRNSKSQTYLWLFLAMVIALSHQAVFMKWTCDDAFISYRYAENLSQGRGLVFNSGERVEGFSNFSWVVLLALFNLFRLSPLWVSKMLSLCFSLFLIGLVFKTARVSGVGLGGALLCSFLVSSATSLAYFSMSGLETVLYAFLLLLAVYLNTKFMTSPSRKTLFYLYAVLFWAAITRPEGILFLLISASYHLGKGFRSKQREALKVAGLPLFLFLSLYAGFILFRYVYYSDILPNTFYAKPLGTFVGAGTSALFVNFSSGLFSGTFLLIPLALFITHKRFLRQNLYPLLFCLVQVFFMSYTGDWMAFGRFFFPVFPLVVISILTFTSRFHSESARPRWKFFASLAAIASWLVFAGLNSIQTAQAVANKDDYPYFVMNSIELTELGKWLKDNFSTDARISLRRQGAVPYYSQMQSLDFLGLTDKTIARMICQEKDLKEEARLISGYIVQQKPDLIILFPSKSEVAGWSIDATPGDGKLIHLEHLIYSYASQEGYISFKEISMGETEKALLLTRPGLQELHR